MKAAVEFYLLMFVFLTLCIMGIESVDMIHQINKVHQFKDYLVNTIDNHHAYDVHVQRLMENNTICKTCSYSVSEENNRYSVDVYFDLEFNFLDLEFPLHLKTFSNMVF